MCHIILILSIYNCIFRICAGGFERLPAGLQTRVRKFGTRVRKFGTFVRKFGTRVRNFGTFVRKFGTRVRNFGTFVRNFGTRVRKFGTFVRKFGTRVRKMIGYDVNRESRLPKMQGYPARISCSVLNYSSLVLMLWSFVLNLLINDGKVNTKAGIMCRYCREKKCFPVI
jgi:hypothetical protein